MKNLRFSQKQTPGIKGLCAAIVRQAVVDYVSSSNYVDKHEPDIGNRFLLEQHRKLECEAFFFSGWFEAICDLDGAHLIRMIDEKMRAG